MISLFSDSCLDTGTVLAQFGCWHYYWTARLPSRILVCLNFRNHALIRLQTDLSWLQASASPALVGRCTSRLQECHSETFQTEIHKPITYPLFSSVTLINFYRERDITQLRLHWLDYAATWSCSNVKLNYFNRSPDRFQKHYWIMNHA